MLSIGVQNISFIIKTLHGKYNFLKAVRKHSFRLNIKQTKHPKSFDFYISIWKFRHNGYKPKMLLNQIISHCFSPLNKCVHLYKSLHKFGEWYIIFFLKDSHHSLEIKVLIITSLPPKNLTIAITGISIIDLILSSQFH